jgi:F-type H+-transporting ATPase subunit b
MDRLGFPVRRWVAVDAKGLFAVCLVLCLYVAAYFAPEGVAEILWEVASLSLLLAVLVYLARKPVLNYLADRRDTIRNSIETSEKLLTDAEESLAGWQQRAAGLEVEVESIREAVRKSARGEAEGILSEAEATAERIRANARSTVEGELRRAREALRREAADLAIELAASQLRDQVTDADRDRLVDEFVTHIERGAEN